MCVILTNGIIGLRKRITATVLSLVIAFGSLPVISAFAESDEAFKGFSYWSVSGGELSAVSGISGYGAGISQNSGNAAKLTSELISVKSGRKYKAGVSVSSSAANADAELTVAFFGDEEGENAVGETLSLEKSSPTADFGEISGDFTPPEGAAYARLIVSLGENGKSGDEYKLDNAYLYIYGTAAPIYADEAVPGYSAGEWARYPDGNGKKWENTASRYIETVDDGCGGDGALHIVNTGIEGDMWLTVVPDSVPAGSYTVRMKVKGSVTAPGQTFRFADSAHIDSGVGNLFADRVSYDDWTDFSYDYESDGTNRFFFVFSQYNGLSDVYIDSLKVVNKETGKDILNGKGDFCLDGGYNLVASNNLAKNGDFEDIVYTYLSPDKFNGNFDGAEVKEEPLKWTLNDNYTGDTLVLSSDSSHGGVLEMTKGASASAGAGWVTLSSPNISVEQGTKYRFSADLKGIGSNPYYIITAYWFFDNGTAPVQVKPAGGEGNLSDGWNTVAADLEAPQNAKEIQLRIVFQGAAGDKMLFDNASLCPLGMSASLDGWQEAGYSSPDPESCYVRLEDNGNADAGSVHIYQDYEKNTARARAGISYMLKGLENGKTYVMELWLKGATQTAGDPLAAELYWGLGNWAKSGNGGLLFDNVNYSEWTKMSYEFTVTNAQWAPLCISPGGYAGVDCYIDNISVYDKSDTAQTNLISNGGFYSYSQPDISRQLIQNGDFENMRVLSAPGWSFSGKTDYDKASSVISLGDNSAAVSYRYNVEGGQIFRTAVNGSGGRLKITFDTGKECEPESSGGIFIVPDGAKYMRVSYISESSATLKGITLTLLENPENYDFEIKDPESERPLNWQYYCGETDSSSYSLKYAANDGVNGSGAMRLTAEKDNDGFAVAYGKRMSAQANGVYRVTFQGKYSGDEISVYPYIRTYNKKGNDTTETSSYNWLTAANSQNNDGEWHSYTADFTAGGDTAFYEVRFEVRAKTAGAKLLFDNISVVYLGDSTDPNLDFESGENGEKVFNWNMYERRENPNKPGEFEEGSFGAYTAVKAEGASKDGSAAVHISKPQAGDVQLYLQSIMLEVGGNTDYLLSYDAMAQGNKKGSLQICVRQYKNAYGDNVKDETEAFKWVTDAYEYGSFDWKSCGGAFKTAKDAKFVKIWLVSNTSDAMDMYIDNVALTKTESIDDPNLDFEYTAGGKPLNWSYVTSDGIASISADKSVYYRGSSSLHIEKQYSRINYTTATMAKRINVNAGDRIEFVIHMRSRNAVSGAFAASLSGYNSSGKLIQSWTGQDRPLNSGSNLSDWQEYRIVYTVPKNVRSVALAMRIGGRKADVYFDSIEYYNYTESNDTVYAEDFASPSSDGMFGGFKKTDIKGNPSFGTAGEAIISGGSGDSAAIEKKIDIINTDYSYQFTAHYRTTGTAVGKLSLTGYNWKNESVGAVVDREISSAPTSTEIKVDFTAINAAYYVLRFEKTGGDGGVALNDVTVRTTAEPSVDLGWEGAWIVHPADYDTIESQKNNERYYYYRQEINLESTVKSAQMQITADDRADVYINGEKVYEETRTGDTWSLPVTLDITEYLQKGKNVIAVRLYNGVYRYALLYDGIVKMDNDSVLRFYTDESVNVARESIGENSTPNPQWSESDADNFMKPDYDMSTGGWTKAEIYANVGSGGWGAIDFDFSEYSDYKIETNEFTFPKNTIYAGDTVTVTATLKIAEKLPEASSFKIYFWKRNSTSRICTGTITLANGKTTKSWPTGKEFTAEFEITVPQFLAAGDYTVQFDNTVAIVSDYYINNKVGSLKIAQYKQEVSTKSEIKMYNGKPTVFVNGVAQAPLWYSRPERDTQFDQSEMEGLASVGIDTSIAFILPRETLGELWMSDGTIKTETIDQQILGTLAANPNSQLVMAIDTTPPQWWLDAHPEECVKLNDGTVSKESFSSELWKKETGEKVTEIINYLMQQPYANNIIGFKITGGTTYEWQWWGINGSTKAGDYSSVGLTAFRAWLKERYKTDAALKSAWGDSSVTLATAAVPSIAVRSETEFGSILSAGKNRQAIDYELFMGEKKTEAMLYFASLVKKATNNRIFVGTYAGYLLNVINYDMAASTSQTSFQKILESDSIDFITCPWNYSEREIGYSGDYMSAVDSVTAHGKLYIAEDDNRNHTTSMFEAPDARASVGWTRTAEQSIEQLKRNFAYALSKGCGLYLYSLAGTYFTDKQLWETASAMMQEMTLSLGLERKSVSDIAVFYDEQSPAYMPYSGSDLTNELLYKGLLLTQRKELYNLGAPYDTYLLDDLEKGLVPEHKINIMLSTTQVTEAERRAISEKLQKNGNVIIWVFTSGMSDGNTTSVDNLSALTGMNMKLIESPNTERKLMGTVEVENYNSWVTEGLADVSFGAIEYRTLAPVIAVDDETAVTLGYHTEQNGYGTNNVGFAMKEMTDGKGNSWTSIYSAVPCIPADILRNVLKHCGCHIYDDTATDIIYADNNYISVHSLFGGEKTVTLPCNYTVYDVFNRKVIAKSVNSFTYSSDKGETRLFRISKNDKIKLYFTRTVGGTVSPEGLNEAEYGGKVTLTFKPNSGYRLGYLLIDGVKTTVNGSSYTFNNIKESHTVAVYYTRLYEKLPLDDNDDPVDPTVPDNGGNNNGHIEPVTPDVKPDNGGTDGDDGRQAITKKNTRYYTTVSLNLPVIIALCAAALAVLAVIVILLIVLLGKNIIFTKNGKRIYSAKIKKGTVMLDKLKEKQGLEGVTATVKKGYAAHHAGQSVNLSLNGAPHTSITLEKGGNNSAEL